jgi:tetratricopeptide (TPR) repeat protein
VVRRRHTDAYLALATRFAPELPGGDQRRIIERLRQDHLNLQGAVRWAIDAGEVELALRLVAVLWRYWQLDGHLAEGAELAAAALAMPGAEAPTSARLGAVTAAGGMAYWQGRQEEAGALYDEQLDLARRLGDLAGQADASFNGIFREYLRRDFDAAKKMVDETARLYEEIGDSRGLSRLDWVRGTLLTQTGHPAESKAIFERAREYFVRSGDTWYEALALGSLAWVAFGEGDARTAIAFYVRSILLGQAIGDMATTAISLEVAAIGALELGQPEKAATLLGALDTACLRYGVRPPAGLRFLISTKEPRERLREALDDAAIAQWMEVGRRMSLDEAVELFVSIATEAGLGLSPAREGR